jgi:hypothetical protein
MIVTGLQRGSRIAYAGALRFGFQQPRINQPRYSATTAGDPSATSFLRRFKKVTFSSPIYPVIYLLEEAL